VGALPLPPGAKGETQAQDHAVRVTVCAAVFRNIGAAFRSKYRACVPPESISRYNYTLTKTGI